MVCTFHSDSTALIKKAFNKEIGSGKACLRMSSFGKTHEIRSPALKAFLAGSISGTFSTLLFQPLDLVKTKIQNHENNVRTSKCATDSLLSIKKPSMLRVARRVFATESILGFWKGITPSITRTIPGVGIYFGSLHWLKSWIGREKVSTLQSMFLGMSARCMAATILIPITVTKTRFESGQFNYTRMSSALIYIHRNEGIRGLSCGLLPTILRDAPYSGIYLMFYTLLKQNYAPNVRNAFSLALGYGHGKNQANQAGTHFSCGILAGFLASLITHPADVLKTKMQIHPEVYHSIAASFRKVLTDSGPKGFMNGFAPRMLRRALMSAFAWTLYEEMMRNMGLK